MAIVITANTPVKKMYFTITSLLFNEIFPKLIVTHIHFFDCFPNSFFCILDW